MAEVNNRAVAELITARLGSLTHPDGAQTQSVLGSTKVLQPAMAEVVTKAADRFGTSIVHTIESEGWTIVRTSDLADLRQQVTTVDPTKAVRVQCNTCGGWLFDLRMTNPQMALTNGAVLRRYFRAEATDGCTCT